MTKKNDNAVTSAAPITDIAGYRTIGNRIYHNGHPIRLFGVNVIGGELVEATIGGLYTGLSIPEFLGHIKSLGFNTIRFPVGPKLIDNVDVDGGFIGSTWHPPNFYLEGKGSLEVFDEWIKECEILGIRYIIDIHMLHNGNIPDLWYVPGVYSEARWLSDIQVMASRYSGPAYPGFIGIDIKNEPNSNTATWGTGNVATDWKIATEKAWQVIAAANDKILIIVEPLGLRPGLQELVDNPPAVPSTRLLYSVHIYGPSVWHPFGEGFTAPNFPANMPQIWNELFADAAQTVPVYIGEFGGKYTTEDNKDKEWQDAFVTHMSNRGVIDFTYWGWGENSGGDTGGILADGGWRNVRTDKMTNLNRIKTPEASFTQSTLSIVQPPDPETPPNEPEALGASAVNYRELLIKLFPSGKAWKIEADTVTFKLLDAIAQEFARVDADISRLLREADPRLTSELLEDWEREFGLPDECTPLQPTLAERRFQLITKIVTTGGQNAAYFQSLVGSETNALTITEDAPTTVPVQIPAPVKGAGFRYVWRVVIPEVINEFFEAGDTTGTAVSETIDPAFVACLIHKYKPAHTHVIFE